MKTYKIAIRFLSEIGTPFHSDTIFGHFCWIYRYIYGEEELKRDILNDYEISPNLIISSGFPRGFLPRPLLPPLKSSELEKFIRSDSFLESVEELMKIRKCKFLSVKILNNLRRNLSEANLIKSLLEEKTTPEVEHFIMPHNSISRLSGMVKEFYHVNYMIYREDESQMDKDYFDIDVYLKTDTIEEEKIRETFEVLGDYGFGKDKSLGKGYFKLLNIEEVFFHQEGNAVMSLSYFIPSSELKEGYYSLLTKFGKLGGHYAIVEMPFKNPLILMEPGSVFRIEKIRDYYGIAIKNIHKKAEIRHQTYLFPYFVNLREED